MRLARSVVVAAAVAVGWLSGAATPPVAQALGSATTVSALLYHPGYFHGQRVVLWGRLQDDGDGLWLESADDTIRVLGEVDSRGTGGAEQVELRALMWDIGRLEPDDPRLAGLDLEPILRELIDRDWPRPGQALILASASVGERTDPGPNSIRRLALDPASLDDQTVTVVGRFRGRNLYGDLPQAPRQSRWDFVVQSGDAAVWVTGKEPKGDGFQLRLTARVDTGRWLEVAGSVRRGGGLVWIEADELDEVEPPAERTTRAAPPPAPPAFEAPPPEVIFSTPIPDDTGIGLTEPVRIQFSEDMDGASFASRVRVGYLGEPEPLPITTRYRPGNRVLEIQFAEPLEPFRTIEVRLLEGIVSVEAQPLAPWSLRYSLGG